MTSFSYPPGSGGGSGNLEIGTTPVVGGTPGYALTNDAGVLGDAIIRTLLTADADYYVDNTTGSDSNDGSIGAPFATLQYAWDHLSGMLDLGQSVLTINLAASGTNYLLSAANGWTGGRAVTILGAGSATTTIADFIIGPNGPFTLGPVLNIDKVSVTENGSLVSCLVDIFGTVNISTIGGDVDFVPGLAIAVHILGHNGILNLFDYIISSSTFAFHLLTNSKINIQGTGTIVGAQSFGTFANASSGGKITGLGSYTGGTVTATQKFLLETNSTVDVGYNVNFFPGDVPGYTVYGGKYVGLDSFIVADLPVAPLQGVDPTFVADSLLSLTAGIGTVVATGGANYVPVYYDTTASNWIVG